MKHISSLLFFSLFAGNYLFAQSSVKPVNSFDVIKYSIKTGSAKDKLARLKKIDSGLEYPTYTSSSAAIAKRPYSLLNGETGFFSVDIRNQSPAESNYAITSNLPANWNVVVRRQALLTDFYTHQRKANLSIDLYGDALPRLMQNEKAEWLLKIKPNEVVRLLVEFKPDIQNTKQPSKKDLAITAINTKTKQRLVHNLSLNVSPKKVPDSKFKSIIFNNNSYQIASYAGRLVATGFSDMVVNGMPTAIFDKQGNIRGALNNNTPTSKEFRYVTDYWLGRNKQILIYWEKDYKTLARLENSNSYLTPYSAEWMNAYVNLLNAAYKNLKLKFPDVTKADITLYIKDEISSGKLSARPSQDVVNVSQLLKYLRKHAPEFKTLITFGIYTFPSDLNAVLPHVDIAVPHLIMPANLTRNAPASYSPVKAFNDLIYNKRKDVNLSNVKSMAAGSFKSKAAADTKPELWSYLVTSGKTSNILDFRALPMYAVILGREGLSWWAFSDRKGSSWLPNDLNALDYSMIYNKEPDNPVYRYWCKDQSETIIPSIRLYAAQAGIQDAKILKYLIENSVQLSAANKNQLQKIISALMKSLDPATGQVNDKKYLSLSEYEDISHRLKQLYVSM